MKMRKIIIVVLIGCLASLAQAGLTPPAGTVVLDDDFDGGTYSDGDLVGQTATNGYDWGVHWWNGAQEPPATLGDYGVGASKSAGYTAGDTNHHSNVLPLGSTFYGDGIIMKFSADIKAQGVAAPGQTQGFTKFSIGINGGRRLTVGHLEAGCMVGDGSSPFQRMRMGKLEYEPNGGMDYDHQIQTSPQLFTDQSLWWHVEAVIDQGVGAVGPNMVYVKYQQLGGSYLTGQTSWNYWTIHGSGGYPINTWMRPINVQVGFDDYGGGVGHLGVDNIEVEVLAGVPSYYFLLGDADRDGDVDHDDYVVLQAEYGQPGPYQADFDNSGNVDFADYLILEAHFGESTPPEPGEPIPEPASLGLLCLGGLLGLVHRRK